MNTIVDKLKTILEAIERRKHTGKLLLEINLNQGKISRIYEVSEKRIELK